jgi:hypothetical protein
METELPEWSKYTYKVVSGPLAGEEYNSLGDVLRAIEYNTTCGLHLKHSVVYIHRRGTQTEPIIRFHIETMFGFSPIVSTVDEVVEP